MKHGSTADLLDLFENPLGLPDSFSGPTFSNPIFLNHTTAPAGNNASLPPPALPDESIEAESAQNGSGGLGSVVAETSGGFVINLLFDAAAMAAPLSFRQGIEQAAAILGGAISDKITVNLDIDYSGTGGGAAAGPDNGQFVSYSTVRADLINNATPGDTTFNALPNGSTIQGQSSVAVWNAQLKVLGLLGANDITTDDGSATFATDINPNLLVGVALHELTHAMGRVPYGPQPDIFDFFRFTSPGTRLFLNGATAPAAYFSLDGGTTKLADYGQTSDASDFLNSGVQGSNDPFNEFYSGSTLQQLTAGDLKELDALGFHTTTAPLPTLLVSNDPAATKGQQIALSNLVSFVDPGHVGYQKLEVWDSNGTIAGGEFIVNGVAQTGGHEIDVTPGNVANTVFNAGTTGGTDTLWARLLQNDGTLTAWQSFTVTVPQPTLSVNSVVNATGGQQIAVSSLVSIADPNRVGFQKLELWDSDGTVAGGQFVVNGTAQIGGHEIDVTPSNVASTVFDTGTSGGTDNLWARLLENDGTLTTWQEFAVTVPTPTLTVSNDSTASGGQHIGLSNLVAITDSGDVGYQKLELWDSDGTTAGGQFVVNGMAQTGGHEIDVTPNNVAGTVFDAGSSSGIDTLWARLELNDGTFAAWQQFAVTVPTPTLTVSNDSSATGGQHIALSGLVSIADPGEVGYQKLELWDSNGTVAGGHFMVNSVAQTGGHEIDVTPGNVAGIVFDAGTSSGTDVLWARLLEADGTLTAWQQFVVTVPMPTLIVGNQSANVSNVTSGQHLALSNLLTIFDPGNVGFQKLELWDSNGTATGGQFVVDGVTQTGGHEIDVTPANVANTVFDVGTSGSSDTLWAQLQLNDGTLSGWQEFTLTAPAATVAAAQSAAIQSNSAMVWGRGNDSFIFNQGIGGNAALYGARADQSVINDLHSETQINLAKFFDERQIAHWAQFHSTSPDILDSHGGSDTSAKVFDLHLSNFIIQ